MTWAEVPVSELYKLPLFGDKVIAPEEGITIYDYQSYDYQSEDVTISVDEGGPRLGGAEQVTPVWFHSFDEFKQV